VRDEVRGDVTQSEKPLSLGDVFHGFARGAFGRDHYNCTKVEAVGPDWIVARDSRGNLSFAGGERDLRFLMRVRDEEPCQEEGGCPLGKSVAPLTRLGGPW
jgi:hypothetical protein